MKRSFLIAVGAALLCAGCVSRAAVPPPRTASEWCGQAAYLLAGGHLPPAAQDTLVEKARNMGCLGQPQEQRLRVTVQ